MVQNANFELLEKIVADQRQNNRGACKSRCIESASKLGPLQKKFRSYYEKGMRVPEDVTSAVVRPTTGETSAGLPTGGGAAKRNGGAGIYYHFDYGGRPARSYKWLNTVPIAKVWEQMNLAYRYGADRIWIVNVGDLKPMEFPIDFFFLNMAWNPEEWPKEKISEFTRLWAERQFWAGVTRQRLQTF